MRSTSLGGTPRGLSVTTPSRNTKRSNLAAQPCWAAFSLSRLQGGSPAVRRARGWRTNVGVIIESRARSLAGAIARVGCLGDLGGEKTDAGQSPHPGVAYPPRAKLVFTQRLACASLITLAMGTQWRRPLRSTSTRASSPSKRIARTVPLGVAIGRSAQRWKRGGRDSRFRLASAAPSTQQVDCCVLSRRETHAFYHFTCCKSRKGGVG